MAWQRDPYPPRALWPLPKRYGHVMAFSEDGKVLADLQHPLGA